jgi:hypothetical protein
MELKMTTILLVILAVVVLVALRSCQNLQIKQSSGKDHTKFSVDIEKRKNKDN